MQSLGNKDLISALVFLSEDPASSLLTVKSKTCPEWGHSNLHLVSLRSVLRSVQLCLSIQRYVGDVLELWDLIPDFSGPLDALLRLFFGWLCGSLGGLVKIQGCFCFPSHLLVQAL